ncbi:MAG: bifunctional metallophosphatase/5'-nucleotidase [Acidobacteriota bacterium]
MTRDGMLTIVQLNDSHAYIDLHQELFWEGGRAVYRKAGGYARIAAVVGQIRKEQPDRVVFCDCGDTLHGTYAAVKTKGAALVPILNALQFDAMSAHWEFGFGPAVLQQRTHELSYPMLASNVYEKATGKPVFPSYIVKDIGGLRIGITGIASNIVDKTMPPSYSEGMYFTLGRDELPPVVDALRTREKADLILLISHLGLPQDVKLLSEVEGVDVCLSGHTHHRLERPMLAGKTILIQSGCHGSFLGRLDLKMEQGRIAGCRHALIEVEEAIAPDPDIAAMAREALAPYRDELSEIVGETATALNRGTMLEATMDNLLLESIREITHAQAAFSNGWRYGAPVIPGPVTVNDLYNMIPMDPVISTVELTGEEIRAMLEENLERTFSCDAYRQMGGYVKRCLGLRVFFKIENPSGMRIQKIFIGDKELNPSGIYDAAYVTVQGVPSNYGRNRSDHSEHIVGAIRKYLNNRVPVHAELKGTFTAI